MTKFNRRATVKGSVLSHPDRVMNEEGGVAFRASPKMELYQRTMTCLVGEPQFYDRTGTKTLQRIRELIHEIAETDPEFILKLAAYARNEMYLRSVPLVLLVEALDTPAKKLVRSYVPRIIRRADELSEVISLFIQRNGQIGTGGNASLPKQFKLGLADAFHNFDAYQFAKYKRSDKEVKLSDVIRLVHPKPLSLAESELFRQIRHNELPVPVTWETVISEQGSTKEAWESVIPKMGYMAKLRNLRNFLKVDVDIEPVLEHLTNPDAVRRSKQFPFRFWSAYKTVKKTSTTNFVSKQRMLDAIIRALETSVENVPRLAGVTAIFNDVSASMEAPVSARSIVEMCEIAALMAAMAYRFSDNAISGKFGEYFKTTPLNKHDSIMTNMEKMLRNDGVGYATNGYLALQWLNRTRTFVDRIMVFTDMQLWDTRYDNNSLAAEYRRYVTSVNPNVKLYLFNLASYGTLQVPEDWPNVCLVSGWSDRVFDFIQRFEEDQTKALAVIENY